MAEGAHVVGTRDGYDAIAEQYAQLFRELDDAPLDRALLCGFADMVRRDHPDAQVPDVGSGAGTVSAHLHRLGLDVCGIDLSPAMVDIARREHPEVSFDVGEMGALDRADAGLAGPVAWYSLVHVPGPQRLGVLEEFHRVLRPGGYVLIAVQVGDDTVHLDGAFGRAISLDFHRLQPDAIIDLPDSAGFALTARMVRAPESTSAATRVPQDVLIARKPGAT